MYAETTWKIVLGVFNDTSLSMKKMSTNMPQEWGRKMGKTANVN